MYNIYIYICLLVRHPHDDVMLMVIIAIALHLVMHTIPMIIAFTQLVLVKYACISSIGLVKALLQDILNSLK